MNGNKERPVYAWEDAAPSLKEIFAGKLRIGAAVNTWNLAGDSPERKTILKQFNVLTLENESKPGPVQPEEGRFVFGPLDRFAAFGEENGIRLRGHTLVWHSQVPAWFFEDADREKLLARMRTHISTVISRFRGRIAVWDVVNEVLKDGGGLRESLWYKIAGEDYIAEAFRAAREADPDARLIINDYNLESVDAKAETMASLVDRLRRADVPVDGIGLQMHLGPDTDLGRLKANVRKLTALRSAWPDLKLEVTELDVSAYRFGDPAEDIDWTEEREKALGERYAALFRFYLELAEEGALDSVVFWGLHDGVSWLNGFPRRHRNYPLLIGRELKLKQAFFDVAALASEK